MIRFFQIRVQKTEQVQVTESFEVVLTTPDGRRRVQKG